MKISISVLLVIFSLNLLTAQGIEFFEGNLAEVKEKAAKEDKLVFIDAYTTWCGPCKWMAKTSFPDEKVGELFNSKFISFKMDMEKGEGLAFAKEYNIKAFPTLIFINSSGDIVHKKVGAMDPSQLLSLGKEALDPEARIGEMINKYKGGEREDVFIKKYLLAASDANIDVKEAFDWYVHSKSAEELMNKDDIYLITSSVADANHDVFKLLMKNQSKFESVIDAPLDRYISHVFSRTLRKSKAEGKLVYDEALSNMKNSGFEGTDKLVAGMEFQNMLEAEDKDWNEITQKIDAYIKKYAPEDSNIRNSMAWDYYVNEDIQDKKILKTALKWAKESVSLQEGYANTDTYAALLYKLKMKKKATKAAERAIELAKESGSDFAETQDLLDKIKAL